MMKKIASYCMRDAEFNKNYVDEKYWLEITHWLIDSYKEYITSLHLSVHYRELPLWTIGKTKTKKCVGRTSTVLLRLRRWSTSNSKCIWVFSPISFIKIKWKIHLHMPPLFHFSTSPNQCRYDQVLNILPK